jgi:hypothetical protein
MLNNVGTKWAIPLAALIAAQTYDLLQFCATDPPSMPTFTALEVASFLAGPSNPLFDGVNAKVVAMVANYLWPTFCQCVTGPTPPTPGPLSEPSGALTVDPPVSVFAPPTNQSCSQAGAFSFGPFTTNSNFLNGPFPIGALGVTSVTWDFHNLPQGGVHTDMNRRVVYYDSQLNVLFTTPNIHVASGAHVTRTDTVPAGTFQYGVFCWLDSAGGTDGEDDNAGWFCGPGTGALAPIPSPCTTDPAVLALLNQILELSTIIQRQAVPFAYIHGAVHSGLSGAGLFAIQGLLGVKVSIASMPGSLGQEGTIPPFFFDAGFITFGTADGYPHSIRVERIEQIALPSRCSAFTQLAYDLHPGVVITITEIRREP